MCSLLACAWLTGNTSDKCFAATPIPIRSLSTAILIGLTGEACHVRDLVKSLVDRSESPTYWAGMGLVLR